MDLPNYYDEWRTRCGLPQVFHCERCEIQRDVEEYDEEYECCESCADDLAAYEE